MLLESLESRRLLAGYALAEYFPSKPGYTWHYSGKSDNITAGDTRTVAADSTAGATVRFDDVVSASGGSQTTRRYYNFNADGAFLVREDSAANFSNSVVTFKSPLHFLNNTIQDGDVLTWSNLPLSAVLDDADLGHVVATGTDTGSSRVSLASNVQLNNGTFIPSALKVVLDHTEVFTGKVQGIKGKFTVHIIETVYLAASIGQVRGDASIKGTIAASGQSEISTTTATFTLDSSNLIAPFSASVDGNGMLTVTGSTGRDLLGVNAAGAQLLVSNGAPAKSFNLASVLGISVFGREGNDQVTISAGAVGAYVDAGPGNDKIFGGAGRDTFTGGAGKDTVFGGDNDDRLNGNGSHDQLFGQAGADRLYGGDGDDILDGGGGVDRLFAGLGTDQLIGGGSNDKLFGEDGNDILYGGNGADFLDGGAGSDQAKNDARTRG